MEAGLKSNNIDVKSLLSSYNKKDILEIKKIEFIGVEGKDVYNITAPFQSDGVEYLAGRVEPREDELNSKVMFFIRKKDARYTWILDKKAPVFRLQDPFVCIIDSEIIFGGVRIILVDGEVHHHTVFFRGKNIHDLKKFARGPDNMKDIRLVQLPQRMIGLFTRPQGIIGGKGRIGFTRIDSLEDLSRFTHEDYFKTLLLCKDFDDEEWLGANAAHILKNGLVGVLGHIACYSKDPMGKIHKNYYPITFALDMQSNEPIGIKIIARRDDFPKGQSKIATLQNVLFAGGFIRHDDGTATVYVGAGDTESYEIKMKDPFFEYEY